MNDNKNFYEILDLELYCEDQIMIRNAWKKAALKNHPDRNLDNVEYAEARMKEINRSYEIFSNPYNKKNYDIFLKNQSEGIFSEYNEYYSYENVDPYFYSLLHILSEVNKYDFSDIRESVLSAIPDGVRNPLVEVLEDFEKKIGIKEQIIEYLTPELGKSSIKEQIRGTNISRTHIVLTNMRMFIFIESSTQTISGNTKTIYTYLDSFSFWINDIIRINLVEKGEISLRYEIGISFENDYLFFISKQELDNLYFLFHLHDLKIEIEKSTGGFLGQYVSNLPKVFSGILASLIIKFVLDFSDFKFWNFIIESLFSAIILVLGYTLTFSILFHQSGLFIDSFFKKPEPID
jgi:DnaJ domain